VNVEETESEIIKAFVAPHPRMLAVEFGKRHCVGKRSTSTFLAKKPFFHLHQLLVFVQDKDIAIVE
jgi:hypothetical protein